ncbi:intercellular trafficking and secretion [Rhizopus stolonifer]|uniref:Sorting nexin-4 n=1 Tax=Rhizopus stolonifer TaxID=4846 RepID=A0A367KSX0_RHIST|nr:intercellular trafficking and secretion [Rhizopus stolonifer]
MTPTTEQFNTQWDILQDDSDSNNVDLISPFTEFTNNEPAVLTPQSYTEYTDNSEIMDNSENIVQHIQVTEPRKEIEQQSTFISYLVISNNNASERALREGQETMMDTIGDTLLNAFTKIRKQDPRFVEMKEKSERMEENLDILQRTLSRTHRRSEELCADYEELQSSVRGLLEVEKTVSMDRFASVLNQYTNQMKQMTISEGRWQMEVYDYMSYYRSIKGVLKLRDQKQLDFEELSEYYQSTLDEKERIVQNKKDGGVANFISDKINEVRGTDAEKIKREKILRLDERLRELQEAVSETHKVSTAFSDQVKKEDMFFNRNKSIELFDVLKSYTDSKVNHFHEGATMWKEFVQALENTP